MNTFICTSVPGFEEILWKEIDNKIKDGIMLEKLGKLKKPVVFPAGGLMWIR